jgi:hypothetical protein
VAVTFDIVICGSPPRTVLCWLRDIVGETGVVQTSGSLRLSVLDQAAMVGVLNRLHDLGLEIERVERTPQVGGLATGA